MKKLLFISLTLGIAFSGLSQNHPIVSKRLRDRCIKMENPVSNQPEFEKPPALPAFKNPDLVDEQIIGTTRYDLQTLRSGPHRINVFQDGTIGAVWTMGIDDPDFPGRGTGYNYYDGNAWSEAPAERIESIKTGWPSYAAYGESGEFVISHDFAAGTLIYLTRSGKGIGTWTESEFAGPGVEIGWNRSTTSGIDNSVMQLLYDTKPATVYEGMDGAILYSRSSDGGETWDIHHALLEEMSSEYYYGLSQDKNEWAASKGDNIAFLVGDFWFDLFLMKSSDGGDTWTKTVIWEHPYPLFDFTSSTEAFYCADGAHHLAFDSQNKIHVVFGINNTYADETGSWWWYPSVGGIGYWNEDMPVFSNDLNALSPYGDPGSELVGDVSLIGWSQDIDGNGSIDILENFGIYWAGLSSQPQIIIDEMDYKYVVFSSVTESYDNGLMNYRHLWARGSWADDVWGEFVQLTDDLIHIYDECVYPSVASKADGDYFYLVYQSDPEPGNSINGTMHAPTDNNINFMKVAKTDLIPLDIQEQDTPGPIENISQNYPNPCKETSFVNVTVTKTTTLYITVLDLNGQVVYSTPKRKVKQGTTRFEIKANNLAPGVYFYRAISEEIGMTKKMIVQ